MSRRSAQQGLPLAPVVSAPADKRFRRSEVRPDRRRRAPLWSRLAVWSLLVLMVVAGAVWLTRSVMHASFLRVQHVVVRGNVRLSSAEIETLLTGLRGENVFHVDLDRYRARLMDSSWVASATLWRVLPGTIEVQILERVPLAVARLDDRLYLLDETGSVIDEYGPRYRDCDLPIVDGLSARPKDGPSASAEGLRLVTALLDALRSRPDLRRRVSQVDVSNPHDAVVLLDDAAVWLHLGDGNFAQRLNTYLELAPTLGDRFADLDYVDLRFDDRVFVRPRATPVRLAKAGR